MGVPLSNFEVDVLLLFVGASYIQQTEMGVLSVPVKHGHARLPVEWPHSSIHQFIERGWMAADWSAADTILLGHE